MSREMNEQSAQENTVSRSSSQMCTTSHAHSKIQAVEPDTKFKKVGSGAEYKPITARPKPAKKANTAPIYLFADIISRTDYTKEYKKSKSKSLERSLSRRVSYPLSDDNTKGKALASNYSPIGDRCSKQQHLDSDSNQTNHQVSTAKLKLVHDALCSVHTSPDFGKRLRTFIQNARETGQWSEKEAFVDDNMVLHFYQIANLVMRSGGDCDLCLLCCQSKDKVDSHIFPKCLLESYSKIHDASAPLFIFDPSSPYVGMHSPNSFVLPLFCHSCNSSTSNEEGLLRDLYLCLMDPKFADGNIKVTRPAWLWYILAAILFRGMLLMNFFELIRNDVFKPFQKALLEIRKYLLSLVIENEEEKMHLKEERKRKMHSIPSCLEENLGLYLLPIGPFQKSVPNITTLFDFTVRNPQHTFLVQDSNNALLCTNFDCFFMILQLNSCKNIPLKDSCLGKTTDQPITLPSSAQRRSTFPSYLLDLKQRQAQVVQTIAFEHNTSISVHTKAITERLPQSQHSVTRFFAGEDQKATSTEEFEFSSELIENEVYDRARKMSPLAESEQVKELIKEKKALEEKYPRHTGEMNRLQKENTSLKEELKECKKEKERYADENKQLQQTVTDLKEQLNARRILEGSTEDQHGTIATPEIEQDLSNISLHEPSSTGTQPR